MPRTEFAVVWNIWSSTVPGSPLSNISFRTLRQPSATVPLTYLMLPVLHVPTEPSLLGTPSRGRRLVAAHLLALLLCNWSNNLQSLSLWLNHSFALCVPSYSSSPFGLRLLSLLPLFPPFSAFFDGGGLTNAKSTLMVWSSSFVPFAPSIAALASFWVGYSTRT